jgi:uncharacterized membrane protein
VKLVARLHRWHQERAGLLAELAIAFLATSRAFETGSLWEYLIGLVFLVGTLQNVVKLARTFMRGPKRGSR